jgi:hypothetical protein
MLKCSSVELAFMLGWAGLKRVTPVDALMAGIPSKLPEAEIMAKCALESFPYFSFLAVAASTITRSASFLRASNSSRSSAVDRPLEDPDSSMKLPLALTTWLVRIPLQVP